jgi:hypothetical protein
LLHFTAVGIENAVVEVGPGLARALDLEDLPQLRGGELDRPRGCVEHDEVVAEPVHLGECDFHEVSIVAK